MRLPVRADTIFIMSEQPKPPCPKCVVQAAEIAKLREDNRRLREQLAASQKTSANSSKPPSSDIVSPPKSSPIPEGQTKRTIGGQQGHAAHFRELFGDLQIDKTVPHELQACPHCQGEIRRNGMIEERFQQVEIVLPKFEVTEHVCPEYWCESCKKACKAPMPMAVQRGGMAGPTLTTLVAFMKGCCHASFSTVRLFLRDVCGLVIARSTLAKIVDRVSSALDGPYDELLQLLPEQKVLNVDETGHPENGKLLWTWCLKADLFTLFKIAPSRKSGVLMELLGKEFDGVLGCDYFSAYRKFMKVLSIEVQFCLAHLIRDVKFLRDLPSVEDRDYGCLLLLRLKELFEVIHSREGMSESEFTKALKGAKANILEAAARAPSTRYSQNMAKRFANHGESYFTFITTPGLDPTNNVAERAFRFVVLDRVVTQGTRGESGRRWCERIWTTLATCNQRGISAFAFLRTAIGEWMEGRESPSLLGEELATS